jgi:RNA polymerase sigma-70 factor (ECF subfamily)
MTSPDDERTLEELRAGDASELERVFRAYYGPLCGFLARYVGGPEAEEIVQDTFLRLWNDRERLQVNTSLRAYLYAAARNRALNHLKRQGIEQRWSEAEAHTPLDAVDPEAPGSLERAEVSGRVQRAIASLPARLRETVELRWGRQWSHAEIAEAMAISVKGVEANVARAKAALKAALQDLID